MLDLYILMLTNITTKKKIMLTNITTKKLFRYQMSFLKKCKTINCYTGLSETATSFK